METNKQELDKKVASVKHWNQSFKEVFICCLLLLLVPAIWFCSPANQRFLVALKYDAIWYANYSATYASDTGGGIRLPAVCACRELLPGTRMKAEDVIVRELSVPGYTRKDRFYFVEDVVDKVTTREIEKDSIVTIDSVR